MLDSAIEQSKRCRSWKLAVKMNGIWDEAAGWILLQRVASDSETKPNNPLLKGEEGWIRMGRACVGLGLLTDWWGEGCHREWKSG